jgi:hypothetical protein
MERIVPTPAARLESGKPLRVWYGVLAAPMAWVLLSSLAWWIGARACADGNASWGPLSPAGVRGLLLGTAAAAMIGGVAGLTGSRRAWRTLSPRHKLNEAYAYGTAEYLATAGVFISAVFLLAIFWTALPAVMVDVCQGTR